MDLDHATKVRRTFHQPVYIATAAPSTIPTTTPSSCRLGTHIARWLAELCVSEPQEHVCCALCHELCEGLRGAQAIWLQAACPLAIFECVLRIIS